MTTTTMTTTIEARVGLNDHEHRLLEWLAAGRTNAQIGQCAGRSEKTIRNQLTTVYAKLGVANRAEAVAVHLRSVYGREG
jgi:DNA-binding CsgD family transcriptional regulator